MPAEMGSCDMDRDSPPKDPSKQIKQDLAAVLSQKGLEFAGRFSFQKTYAYATHPLLDIKDVGLVGLPLSKREAKFLISKATQAPFGQGERTVVDTEVRDTWEIDGSRVKFRNPVWEPFMKNVTAEVCKVLGVDFVASEPRCELYKLLIYEEGSHFLPHTDTEKANGMFATVVVVLPSQFTGGVAHLSHGGVSTVYDIAASSDFHTSVLAWYTDVMHEIKPIQSGYRLALTYNLLHATTKLRPILPVSNNVEAKLRHILLSWKYNLATSPQKIIYLLGHKYSKTAVREGDLKGADADRVAILEPLAKELGFELGLATIECHLSGYADDEGPRRYRNRYCYYDEDPEDDEVDFMEIEERQMTICELTSLNGVSICDDVPYDEGDEDCIPENLQDIVEEGPVDEQDYEGYMGNGAGSLERWYRRTVLVIWPSINGPDFDAGSVESVLSPLRETETPAPTPSERYLVTQALAKTQDIDSCWSKEVEKVVSIVCDAACAWKDSDMWRNAYSLCNKLGARGAPGCDGLAGALEAFGFEGLRTVLEQELLPGGGNAYRYNLIKAIEIQLQTSSTRENAITPSDNSPHNWLCARKEAFFEHMDPPIAGEVPLFEMIFIENGGAEFLRARMLPALQKIASPKFLLDLAIAILSIKKISSHDHDLFNSSDPDPVREMLTYGMERVFFWRHVTPHDIKSPLGLPCVTSAQLQLYFVTICGMPDSRGLLSSLCDKVFDLKETGQEVSLVIMRAIISPLLNTLKSAQNGNPALIEVRSALGCKMVDLWLDTASQLPTFQELVVLVDQIPVSRNSEIMRLIQKLKSLPFDTARWKEAIVVLRQRNNELLLWRSDLNTSLDTTITDLVKTLIGKQDLDKYGNKSFYPNPIIELLRYCKETGNTNCYSDVLGRAFEKVNKTTIQSSIVPLLPALIQYAKAEKIAINSEPFASTLKRAIDLIVSQVLGPKPPGNEPQLANIRAARSTCSCNECRRVMDFLASRGEASLRMERIGAPKRKHIEQTLVRFCSGCCTWETISSSPQGLKVHKNASFRRPVLWDEERLKTVTILQNVSTDVNVLADIFGVAGLLQLCNILGWPTRGELEKLVRPGAGLPPPHRAVVAGSSKTAVPSVSVTPQKRKLGAVIDLCTP